MSRPQQSKPARLIDLSEVTGGASVTLDRDGVRIGRSPSNDFVLKEATISGKHARIDRRDGGHAVIDLNSTNGTRVNGRALDPNVPCPLRDGDEVCFDKYRFTYRAEEVIEEEPEGDYDATVMLDGAPEWNAPAAAADDDATIAIGGETPWRDPGAPAAAPRDADGFDAPPDGGDETVFLADEDGADAAPADGFDVPAGGGEDETVFLEGDAEAAPAGAPAYDGTVDLGSRTGPAGAPAGGMDETQPSRVGSYEIQSLLGRGGFGSVWKATDSAGNPVAVKLLNPEVLENERAVRKFFHEAIILSKLDHPSICRFIDFFPHAQNYAIVMDFVQGTDLKTLLKEKNGPLPLETAIEIAGQSLDAFHYAHQAGVMHRDIKPENIIRDQRGVARVMDFGIAKLSSSETQHTSVFMISPAYTAPERFDVNNTVDHRSDIYSLGLLFYELFTGGHPFKVNTPTEMILAHLNTVPPPPAEVADVPRPISDAILKALAKAPEDRFEDFAAFKAAMFGGAPAAEAADGPAARPGLGFEGQRCPAGAALLVEFGREIESRAGSVTRFELIQDGPALELILHTADGRSERLRRDVRELMAGD